MGSSSFKVIVVGGGPVGLTAAHALGKAGIDFLVLERRPQIVMDVGSNVVMMPVGLRAMAQLDLLEPLNLVSTPLGRIDRLDHSGNDMGDLQFFNRMKKIHGLAPRVISRHDLMKVLYDTLSADDQNKILSNKTLSDITPTADGVLVSCADGSSYPGSLVLGADGAHSAVRDIMRTLALSAGAGPADVNPERPFLTTYRALWVRFPRTAAASLAVGTTCETHGRDAATQLFVGERSGVVGVYERMEAATRQRSRYTQADQDALVRRWGHLPLLLLPAGAAGAHTLADVYAARLESGLVSLEEGMLDHWSCGGGRVVLAGDAAHKFTPSTGAGCNNGIVDVVALVNELHGACDQRSHAAATPPSREDLARACQAYQTARRAAVGAELARASQATATATWQTNVHRFVDRHVVSKHVVQNVMIDSGAKDTARTPALRFSSGQGLPIGRMPWAEAPTTVRAR